MAAGHMGMTIFPHSRGSSIGPHSQSLHARYGQISTAIQSRQPNRSSSSRVLEENGASWWKSSSQHGFSVDEKREAGNRSGRAAWHGSSRVTAAVSGRRVGSACARCFLRVRDGPRNAPLRGGRGAISDAGDARVCMPFFIAEKWRLTVSLAESCPSPKPNVQNGITPGAFCSPEGAKASARRMVSPTPARETTPDVCVGGDSVMLQNQ